MAEVIHQTSVLNGLEIGSGGYPLASPQRLGQYLYKIQTVIQFCAQRRVKKFVLN